MVVDKDKDLAVEAVYQALILPVASRIYALGMARRELDLKASMKDRRIGDRSASFREWQKLMGRR
jgi:hypothetical protein